MITVFFHSFDFFDLVVREQLKVRQALAQPRLAESSFASMIAEMGKPKAVSTGRKKNPQTHAKKNTRIAGQSGRFSVETNSSSDSDKTTPPPSAASIGTLLSL